MYPERGRTLLMNPVFNTDSDLFQRSGSAPKCRKGHRGTRDPGRRRVNFKLMQSNNNANPRRGQKARREGDTNLTQEESQIQSQVKALIAEADSMAAKVLTSEDVGLATSALECSSRVIQMFDNVAISWSKARKLISARRVELLRRNAANKPAQQKSPDLSIQTDGQGEFIVLQDGTKFRKEN